MITKNYKNNHPLVVFLVLTYYISLVFCLELKKNYVSLDHCFLFSRNRADGTKRTKNWAFFSFEVIVNMFSLISEQFSRSVPPKNRKLEGLLSLLAFTLNNFLIIASATVLAALIIAKVNFSRYEPFCKTIVKLSEI